MRNQHRFILSLFWSLASALILAFIVYKHGAEKEILTLIIGILSGTIIGGIFGHYFSSNHKPINEVKDEEEIPEDK